MKILVKTKHYVESTCYLDNDNCPLATAIKEQYPEVTVWVGGFTASVDGIRYNIGDKWGELDYDHVQQKISDAKKGKHIPTIEVELEKIQR